MDTKFNSVSLDSLNELFSSYHQVTGKIKTLEAEKNRLKRLILSKLPEDRVVTPDFKVTKIKATRINTSLEDARALGATKTAEVVDKETLKCLLETGIPVPGVHESEYFRLTEVKEGSEKNAPPRKKQKV